MTPPMQRATRRPPETVDRTTVRGDVQRERADADQVRADLSARLVSIRPLDAVRFVFNDVVDRRTFQVRRTSAEPNALSISYADDAQGTGRTEGAATDARAPWLESRSRNITGYGQYAWQDSRTLLIGPPEGGWPAGKYVFFEFDKSLKDDAGNALKGGRDQVVVARIQSDARCVILRPEQDDWFVPWRGGDDIFGRAEDFSLLVVGQIIQHGATLFPSKVIVTATSNRGLVVSAEIMCGDHERRELRKGLGWSDWAPDRQFGGQWAIRLKLQSESWSGKGAQAVAEGHHTWSITATVVMASGLRIRASNKKVVRFELYQPRLLMLFCPQIHEHHGVIYHWKYGQRKMSRLNFGRQDLGLKQFILVFDGEFDIESGFSFINTYLSEEARKEVLYWERRWSSTLRRWVTWVYLPGFHIHNRVRDILINGRYRNRTTHTFTVKVTTVAGFVMRITFPFEVDTLPLDLVDVAAVRGRLLRSSRFDIDSLSAAEGGFYINYGSAGRERIFVSYADLQAIGGGGAEIDWDQLGFDVDVTTAWDEMIFSGEMSQEIEISETAQVESEIEIEALLEEFGGGMFMLAGEVMQVDSAESFIEEDFILGGGFWQSVEEFSFETEEEFELDLEQVDAGVGVDLGDGWCDQVGETVRVVGRMRGRAVPIDDKGHSIAVYQIIDREGMAWDLIGEDLRKIEQGQAMVVTGLVNEDCAIVIEEIELLEEKPAQRDRIPPNVDKPQRIPQEPVVRQRLPHEPVVRRRVPPAAED